MKDQAADGPQPSANDPPTKAVTVVKALYLFAGAKRKASVKEYLAKHCRHYNLKLKVHEVDILRGGRRHDLSVAGRRRNFLNKIESGEYHVVLTSPPCGTFSRARWANRSGPAPLRLRHCPRGFPWLAKGQRQGVDLANSLVDFSTDALKKQFQRSPEGLGIMEHPEDLGVVRNTSPPQHPGSIWHFKAMEELLTLPGVRWGALAQSDFGTSYPKPTRLLGRLPGLEQVVHLGPPAHDAKGVYTGPLPPVRGGAPMQVGRDGSGAFRTTATAAWPPALCDALALRMVKTIADHNDKILKAGDTVGSSPTSSASTASSGAIPSTVRSSPPTSSSSSTPAPAVPGIISRELLEGLPPGSRTTRVQIDDVVARKLKNGEDTNLVYVGRGGRGIPHSTWGNPFKIGTDGSRDEVIEKFRGYLVSSGLGSRARELRGCTLVCHCRPDQPCHADVLIEHAEEENQSAAVVGACEAEGDVELRGGADTTINVDHSECMDVDGYVEGPVTKMTDEAYDHKGIGKGPPRRAMHMGRDKPFTDGGGLCSPGRWAPQQRRRHDYGLNDLRDQLYVIFRDATRDEKGRRCTPLDFVLRLACGRFETSPFPEESLAEARSRMEQALGLESPSRPAEGQSFYLSLISGLLKLAEDPDWQFFPGLAEGVALGVGEAMPRTPKVFEEKTRWKLDEAEDPGVAEKSNYKSLEPHRDAVEKLFREEQGLGWMIEMSDEEAKQEFGDRLHVAALAVVEEPGKIRVVHDGSNAVLVNHKIRPRDQTRAPGAGEVRAIMREKAVSGKKLFALAGDVAKAHRRIKVRRADWGFQACRLRPGSLWLNCVGTYGMGSAAYYWARFAAGAQVRLGHYILGGEFALDLLLYVDDFLGLAEDKSQIESLGFLIFFWLSLGFFFRWPKFKGGSRVEWVGYWMDFDSSRLGVSARRAEWLSHWLRTHLELGYIDIKEFQAVLGRLCFAVGPLEYTRPFLAPLYAWLSSIPAAGRFLIPWSVRFLFSFIAGQFDEEFRTTVVKPRGVDLGVAFSADAKAEGQLVVLGGWECIGGTRPDQARWFAVELTRANAPWAFSRGEPFRCIAALELFASLLCVVVFGKAWPASARGSLQLGGVTDNLGNSFALTRMMTSKFPSVVILTEFALQLRRMSAELNLSWVPRDQNEEADALTNGHFDAFNEDRRITINIDKIEWMIMNKMLKVSEDIYHDLKEKRAARTAACSTAPARTRPEDRLRVKDRW